MEKYVIINNAERERWTSETGLIIFAYSDI